MSLTNFVKNAGLVFELEYRDEGLVFSNFEEFYPRIFRVVSGDAALSSLNAGDVLAQIGR